MINILADEGIDQFTILNLSSIENRINEFSDYLLERKKLGLQLDLEEAKLDSRLNAYLNGKAAKSIICIFLPYLSEHHCFESNISVSAQSIDYHIWGKEKLKNIVEVLKRKYTNSFFEIQVDNGPLNERFFALESGLGYKGLNNMIINSKYGSYGFIGLIVTDTLLEEKVFPKKSCFNCKKCIEVCPGNALSEEGIFYGSRCASYITQKKGDLSEDEIRIIKRSNKIYGCDICQIICPHNIGVEIIKEEIDVLKDIHLSDIKNLSNNEFKKKFRNRAFAWRGKKNLIRNLNIIKD